MTVGADGLGLISYFDAYERRPQGRALRRTSPARSASTPTLDSSGTVGATSSVTIGADGLGLISYLDVTNHDLKVAHCASTLCVDYLRRR